MIGGPIKLAVNGYILHDPTEALALTGALVAAGGVVGLRQLMRHVGLNEETLSDEQRAEVELLDAAAPHRFFGTAIEAVHCSLLGWKMRGSGLTRVGWLHGRWAIKGTGLSWDTDPALDEEAQLWDLVDVSTPAMDRRGILR